MPFAQTAGPYELAPLDGRVAAAVELIDRDGVSDLPDGVTAATALSLPALRSSAGTVRFVRHRFRQSGSTPQTPAPPILRSPDPGRLVPPSASPWHPEADRRQAEKR
jgi:hypothetical protein